jgi:hypothetical protein
LASKVIITILAFLLIGSNVFWLYHSIDSSVTASYRNGEFYELRSAEAQAVRMLEKVLNGKAKAEIQTLATPFTDLEPFEKDGCLWVGWYGFKFTSENKLSGITSIYINENSICKNPLIKRSSSFRRTR